MLNNNRSAERDPTPQTLTTFGPAAKRTTEANVGSPELTRSEAGPRSHHGKM